MKNVKTPKVRFVPIAAANALSDVYAMGGEPKLCLNIMAIPKDMPGEAVHRLLRGGYDKVYEARKGTVPVHALRQEACLGQFRRPRHEVRAVRPHLRRLRQGV